MVGNDGSRRLAEGVGFDFGGSVPHRIEFRGEERDAQIGVLLRRDGSAHG